MKSFVRISALKWTDILVNYALFALQTYLTNVWELDFTHAAVILNISDGISKILPVFFIFLADAFLGNFKMLVLSRVAYSVGIGFIFMSTPPVLANSTGTCKQYEQQCIGHTQKVLFYTGLALIVVGKSGHRVSLHPFLEEQKDKSDKDEGNKATIQMAGFFVVVLVPIIGAIVLPYMIKPWSVEFGIPAICTVVATLLFFSGWCEYTKVEPDGSPLTNVCRVFVASASKISQRFDDKDFYKKDGQELQQFSHTHILRCLEKAAIILPGIKLEEQENNRWLLCTVAEVEEVKTVVRMVPMWMTFIICGIVSSVGNTYFLEQANHMDSSIGNWIVPLPIFLMLFTVAKKLFACFYDKMANSFARGFKKYAPPTGIAVAMIFSVLCCITAAKIEIRRLKVIRRHGLLDMPDEEVPMSVYWLLFQFFLLAGLDSFFEESVAAFLDDQAPESMRNCLEYFTKGIFGLGVMYSVLSVYVVGKISEMGANQTGFSLP